MDKPFLMCIMPDRTFTNGADALVLQQGELGHIPLVLNSVLSRVSKGDQVYITETKDTPRSNGEERRRG